MLGGNIKLKISVGATNTIDFFQLQPNICCEKQILADQKMNGGVHCQKKSRKIKKLSRKFYKYFQKFLFFSEFFWEMYFFIHFLIGCKIKIHEFKDLQKKKLKKLKKIRKYLQTFLVTQTIFKFLYSLLFIIFWNS